MENLGSLVDTNLRIFPSKNLLNYLKSLPIDNDVPLNIARLVKGKAYEGKNKEESQDANSKISIHLDNKDIENLNKIKEIVKVKDKDDLKVDEDSSKKASINKDEKKEGSERAKSEKIENKKNLDGEKDKKEDELHLVTSDIDWLYIYLQKQRKTMADGDKTVPYLHVLLEGARIETPKNQILQRNPILEARCVKLRAQQEAREYRKMTKSVDNVRIRYPEDNINYQLKQINRQLIAIGQFIISIFAGFLFGFRGIEWMVGNLDFGFRLLLGVMCALVIALAEIYFLAKRLNEELHIETVQLGGPTKFADQEQDQPQPHIHVPKELSDIIDKEHQD